MPEVVFFREQLCQFDGLDAVLGPWSSFALRWIIRGFAAPVRS